MSRNRATDATLTLPGIKRPVGRPRKADALTGSERQQLHRQRVKASAISVTGNENSNHEHLPETLDDMKRQYELMTSEVCRVYDLFGIVEILAFLAPQGVTFDQVYVALMSLTPTASAK